MTHPPLRLEVAGGAAARKHGGTGKLNTPCGPKHTGARAILETGPARFELR